MTRTSSLKFDRWKLANGQTYAYSLFKKHHTELNSLYWSYAPTFKHAYKATKGLAISDKASTVFALPAPDDTRINLTLKEWSDNFNSFDNWVRLNAILSSLSYFEVYMRTIIQNALQSDPGVIYSSSHSIDGIKLVKTLSESSYKKKLAFDEEVRACTRGTWSERTNYYKVIFGHIPQLLENNISTLDNLRKLRNGVAHTFGRSADDYNIPLIIKPKPFQTCSIERLRKSLGLIEKLAQSIEHDLSSIHIGEFESLLFYHRWDKKYDHACSSEHRALSEEVFRVRGNHRGLIYYENLIRYYKH